MINNLWDGGYWKRRAERADRYKSGTASAGDVISHSLAYDFANDADRESLAPRPTEAEIAIALAEVKRRR